MNVDEIHGRLRELMEERGYSSYRLAELSGMSQSSLYNMFERKTMPKLDTLEQLCDGLDITLCDFFIYKSKPGCVAYVSNEDAALLEINHSLSQRGRERLLSFASGFLEGNRMADE